MYHLHTNTFGIVLLLLLAGMRVESAEYFVAPDGDDANSGSMDRPFAGIQRAQEAASPGDTIHIRGGKYLMKESQIASRQRIWAYVHLLNKSGSPGKRIRYQAYRDERPVFDFSEVRPAGRRIDAFHVTASWVHLKGIEVTGVQVTMKGHTQSICFANNGSHNIYEMLSMHDGQAIGLYSVRGSDNLFLNCDAYRNHDFTSEDGRGGNVDGFGCHPREGDSGNIFRGCRAWFNSDDGFDCINAHESVVFENCWAFYNGYSPGFERRADGNGFKAGGYGSTPAEQLPKAIPRHVVRFSLAVRNRAAGFYANHHPGGCDWFNNTAWRNGVNFNMLGRLSDNRTDVDGFGHKLRNNLGYRGGAEIVRLDRARSDAANNSFDMEIKPGEGDFLGLDETELLRPRQANGDLPEIRLLHPAPGGQLIDRGVDIGFPYRGARPDLGAFEH